MPYRQGGDSYFGTLFSPKKKHDALPLCHRKTFQCLQILQPTLTRFRIKPNEETACYDNSYSKYYTQHIHTVPILKFCFLSLQISPSVTAKKHIRPLTDSKSCTKIGYWLWSITVFIRLAFQCSLEFIQPDYFYSRKRYVF